MKVLSKMDTHVDGPGADALASLKDLSANKVAPTFNSVHALQIATAAALRAPVTRTANFDGVARPTVEPFFTLKEAATHLNIKYWLLLRMAKRGELPTYVAGNTRKRVLLSEVTAAIRQSKEGDQ